MVKNSRCLKKRKTRSPKSGEVEIAEITFNAPFPFFFSPTTKKPPSSEGGFLSGLD